MRLGLHLVPTSLSGCLWLQFASAVDGNRTYRRCAGCGRWLEHSPQVARADRKFCSDSCKASAHRKKILKARKLHQDGAPLAQIAKRLGDTDAKTVKGWISK
jgi:hypothetical protein